MMRVTEISVKLFKAKTQAHYAALAELQKHVMETHGSNAVKELDAIFGMPDEQFTPALQEFFEEKYPGYAAEETAWIKENHHELTRVP